MKKMFCKRHKIFLVVILLSLIKLLNFSSCQTTEPPVTQGKIILESLDASSTEVWLKLSVQELSLPQNVTFTRNDTIIETLTVDKPDTVFYDEGLLPNQNYKYRAIIQSASQSSVNNQSILRSEAITVTTMDTTSHNFTWETFTFGGANGSSVLNDVAIINENDIWAVGEIYENGEKYNAVHWDGNEWELKRILYKNGFWDINCIYAFGENDIWFEAYMRWDSERFIALEIPDVLIGWGIKASWGASSEDFYVVGNNGNIAHYDGSRWEKIEIPAGGGTSGTDEDIEDIWGDSNGTIIFTTKYKLFRLSDNQNLSIEQLPDSFYVKSIWFKNQWSLFICGGGVYKGSYNNNWQQQTEIPNYFTNKIRGNESNNIFVVGVYGLISHFNGISWKNYIQERTAWYKSIDIKGKIAVAVGFLGSGINDKAIIAIRK